jgi:hypothetical protein
MKNIPLVYVSTKAASSRLTGNIGAEVLIVNTDQKAIRANIDISNATSNT